MEKKYKALIVDDERLARKDLSILLSDFENIEIIGEADSVSTALKIIQNQHPDLIFLDIQMPGETGFDLLERINDNIKVVFITAFDEYAIRAFDVNALDYLLKPVHPDRLRKTIEKIKGDDKELIELPRKLEYDDCLFVLLNSSMKFLKINTIKCITAAGDYSEIITTGKDKGLVLKSMKEWEMRLPNQYFCRIHRSTIINMEYIAKLEEWFNYSYRIYLRDIDSPYIMSRRYVSKIKQRLG